MHQEQSDTEFLASCFDPEEAKEDMEENEQTLLSKKQYTSLSNSLCIDCCVDIICELTGKDKEKIINDITYAAYLRGARMPDKAKVADEIIKQEDESYKRYKNLNAAGSW